MDFRSVHKWLMLVLGLQFLIWSGSGLYMVLVDIHFIHGETLVERPKLNLQELNSAPLQLGHLCGDKGRVKLISQLNTPVLICHTNEAVHRFDLNHNQLLGPVTQAQAEDIATENLAQAAAIKNITFFETEPPPEVSPRYLPFWRVEFDTIDSATLYVNAESGEVVTKRHTYWRLFDWMWRFHIMDYDDGENVKNGLLTFFVGFSLIATGAGMVLMYRLMKQRTKMTRPWFVKFHGLLASIVGLQFMVWLLTGAFFNLLSGPEYSPNLNRQSVDSQIHFNGLSGAVIPPMAEVQRVSTTLIEGVPHWLIEREIGWHDYQNKSVELRQIPSNQTLTLDKGTIERIALSSYKGDATALATKFVAEPGSDYPQQANSYWRVELSDDSQTWIFVDSQSGKVLKHSNEASRFKDLMLKLHFMDYFNEGGFNHFLMYLFALLAMGLALTGAVWTVKLMKAGQFRWMTKKANKSVLVQINGSAAEPLELVEDINLYAALKTKGIILPSSCQGAGTCGHCITKISPPPTPSLADIAQIKQSKIEQGYRLACQHVCGQIQQCAVKSVRH